MYKNINLRRIRQYLKYNQLTPFDQINWVEVYKFWLDHHVEIEKKPRISKSDEHGRLVQRVRTMNYRANRCGDTINKITIQDLIDVANQCGHKCVVCGERDHLVYDHKIAYFNGGKNVKSNLQLLCRICNMKKGVSE